MVTLKQIEGAVRAAGLLVCPKCGTTLGPAQTYDHEGGWKIEGYAKKQWVYFGCVKCDYDWALWKLLDRRETQYGR